MRKRERKSGVAKCLAWAIYSRNRTMGLLASTLLTGAIASSALEPVAIQPTRRAHPSELPKVTAEAESFSPRFTPDSRSLLFLSSANNLAPHDNRAPWIDIFSYSLESQRTELISVNWMGAGGGNGNSRSPVASVDGRFIAFLSDATDLTDDVIDEPFAQVFLRDLQEHRTMLVTRGLVGTGAAGKTSSVLISEDGSSVVFESVANNLVQGASNPGSDIYTWNRVDHTMSLVSASEDPTWYGQAFTGPTVSGDGRYIAFEAQRARVVQDDTSGFRSIYLRDMQLPASTLASDTKLIVHSQLNTSRHFHPVLTPDGRYLAYKLRSPIGAVVLKDLWSTNRYWIYPLGIGSTIFISDLPLSVDPDGRHITLGLQALYPPG